MISEREVLMGIVARDVAYDSNVLEFASPIPLLLTESDAVARAVQAMAGEGVDNIPLVDSLGRAIAVLRALDIIDLLAEAFPEQILNLPLEPHQTLQKAEVA